MQDDKKTPNNTINIELSEEIADGTYSNFSIISHMQQEFILDFVRIVPNVSRAKVQSRVIMNPQQAKRLMMALRENIKMYENAFGLIKDDQMPPPPIQFNKPKGEA